MYEFFRNKSLTVCRSSSLKCSIPMFSFKFRRLFKFKINRFDPSDLDFKNIRDMNSPSDVSHVLVASFF